MDVTAFKAHQMVHFKWVDSILYLNKVMCYVVKKGGCGGAAMAVLGLKW